MRLQTYFDPIVARSYAKVIREIKYYNWWSNCLVLVLGYFPKKERNRSLAIYSPNFWPRVTLVSGLRNWFFQPYFEQYFEPFQFLWHYLSLDSHWTVIGQSLDSHWTVIGQSLNSHQTVIEQLLDIHCPSDSHQVIK